MFEERPPADILPSADLFLSISPFLLDRTLSPEEPLWSLPLLVLPDMSDSHSESEELEELYTLFVACLFFSLSASASELEDNLLELPHSLQLQSDSLSPLLSSPSA